MKVISKLLLISAISLSLQSTSNQRVCTKHLIEYYYLKFDTVLFHRISAKFEINPNELISIVMPEYIRYSRWRNYIETKSLKLTYVAYGSAQFDFSIGIFQMKPSFVEKIETTIFSNTALNEKYYMLRYLTVNRKEQRRERIERLTSDKWQSLYLCAFYDITKDRFRLSDFGDSERISVMAGYYNLGLQSSLQEILQWNHRAYFTIHPNCQAPYADISALTYKIISGS